MSMGGPAGALVCAIIPVVVPPTAVSPWMMTEIGDGYRPPYWSPIPACQVSRVTPAAVARSQNFVWLMRRRRSRCVPIGVLDEHTNRTAAEGAEVAVDGRCSPIQLGAVPALCPGVRGREIDRTALLNGDRLHVQARVLRRHGNRRVVGIDAAIETERAGRFGEYARLGSERIGARGIRTGRCRANRRSRRAHPPSHLLDIDAGSMRRWTRPDGTRMSP